MKKLIKSVLALVMAIVLVVPAGNVSAGESAHTHTYAFVANGDTLTVTCTCDSCDNKGKVETFKLISNEKTYDGTIYNLAYIENWENLKEILGGNAEYEFEYKLGSNSWESGIISDYSDAEEYTVRAKISNTVIGTKTLESTFRINPRNVTIVAGSASKEYDGTPLTDNTFTIKEYTTDSSNNFGFVGEEGIESVVMTAESSITNPGTVKNVINPNLTALKGGTYSPNYNFTFEEGTLEVTKATCGKVPENLIAVKPSHYGISDGAISGTAIDMEYSRNTSFTDATDCSADETTGLAAGTYYVRIKENDFTKASNYITIVIPNGDGYTPSQGSGNEDNGGSQSSSSEGNSGSQSSSSESTDVNNESQTATTEGNENSENNTDVNNAVNNTDNEVEVDTAIAALDLPAEVEQTISEMAKTEEGAESVKLLEQILTANKSEGDAQNSDNQNADSSAKISVEVSETSPENADKGSIKNGVFKSPEGETIMNSFVESTNNGKKYFADENGKKVTNAIVTDGEKLYYCNKSGIVQTNKAVTLDNNVTVLTDKTGAIITESDAKVSVGGKIYITGEGGAVVKGSKATISVATKKNGKTVTVERTYITNKKGVVQTGIVKHKKKNYVTSKTGIVQKNKITKINGKKVYANKNGVLVVNKTITVDGIKYKADSDGFLTKVK